MKAITIWQPWASFVACGVKKYETRGWATKYRGPIAIHAAKREPCRLPLIDKSEVKQYTTQEIDAWRCPPWPLMPRGAIIATAELVNVWRIVQHPGTDVDVAKHIPLGAESLTLDKHAPDFGAFFVPTEQEIALGDWTPGRYAWELQNVKLLPHPVPVKGQQGLWNWEPEKCCDTCEWYVDFAGVCTNGESEKCADDVICGSDSCGHWEPRKGITI